MNRRNAIAVGIVACAFCAVSCRRSGEEPPKASPGSGYAKCATGSSGDRRRLCAPSLTELIVRRDWYDGARVSVTGILSMGYEDSSLFPSSESHYQRLSESAVWLDIRRGVCQDCPSWGGRWVSVTGTYRAKEGGHMGIYNGALVDIENVSLHLFNRDFRPPLQPVPVDPSAKPAPK